MLAGLRRLLLGLILIAAASAALVLSDRSGQRNDLRSPIERIAVLQINSIQSFEDARRGLLEYLADRGVSAQDGDEIILLNAEGDVGTLGQMATQLAGDDLDLIITLSTPATQAMIRANQRGTPHVFGLVASPPAAGIPLGAWSPESPRPRNVAGFGTMQPIGPLFEALRECAPSLRRVGCVWNPAEPNAEASVRLGREVAARLGFELLEANGASVTEVVAAADVLASRGIEAFWILADTNVLAAAPTVIARCRAAGLPVVTNFPAMWESGGAINLGADYPAMGRATGAIAELVLRGVPPSDVAVEDFVPAWLSLNLDAFPASWRRPQQLLDSASIVLDGAGPPIERSIESPLAPPSVLALLADLPPLAAPRPERPRIAAVTYNRTSNFEDAWEGFTREMERLGYRDGENCEIDLKDAQLDIAALNTIAAAFAQDRHDVVVPFTTPALQAVLRKVKDRPIVFSLIGDAVGAGAGRSNEDHLPNVTGAIVAADWEGMIRVLKAVAPDVRRVGTAFAPGEANSVIYRDQWKAALEKEGIELVSVAADRPTELPEAIDAVIAQGVEIITQISDVVSGSGFPAVSKAADRANLPVFGFTPAAVSQGATLAVSRDYREVGANSAILLDRVLRGEDPKGIPFMAPRNTDLFVDPARLARFGIRLTPELQALVRQSAAPAAPAPPETGSAGSSATTAAPGGPR